MSPLFRKGENDDGSGKRSAAERERARLEREARRSGTPVEEVAEPAPRAYDPVTDPPPAPAPEPAEDKGDSPLHEDEVEPEPVTRVHPADDFDWEDSRTPAPAPAPAPSPAEPPTEVAPPVVAREPVVADPPLRTPPLPARTARRGAPRPTRGPRLPTRDRAPGAPRPATRPRRLRTWGGRLFALLSLIVVGAALWFGVHLFQPGKGGGHGKVPITVPKGASAREIGDLLARRGVVSSGFYFDLRARISGKRDKLEAGRFIMARDMSYGAALDRLLTKPAARPTVAFTIPEGRSRREEAAVLAKARLSGDYLEQTRTSTLLSPRTYGAPKSVHTLEGFLFPATYDLPRGNPTAADLVREQLKAFKQNFGTVSMKYAKSKHLNAYDVLTIASMVEREAELPKDRPLIAAVIYNRLKQGIPLGIDATIRYALDKQSGALTVSDLAIDSPYNSRTHLGLPPTPIGSPGLASIRAAAHPAKVSYLYFVVKAGGCGQHVFSSTDAKFQQDVAKYNSARAANGDRSPTRKC